MNLVALIGRLARPAEERTLPSGDRLVTYEITVPRPDTRAETVPVVWFEAPASALDHEVDTELVVVGRVRRRFFQVGGSVQSRTEVVADVVVPSRQARRARQALELAADTMGSFASPSRKAPSRDRHKGSGATAPGARQGRDPIRR